MKKCGYRNCDVKFTEEHKQYCCRKCKNSESVYRFRSKKPKGKTGRPKHIYKRLKELTQDDIRLLELIFKQS
jgi:hypothetical protein